MPRALEIPTSTSDAYERHRQRAAERSRLISREGRDIGSPPEPVDPARRDACRLDLRLFCETYLAEVFSGEWSDDHVELIAELQRIIIEGGKRAFALPRGAGKSSICEAAALWCLCFGHRRFLLLVQATGPLADAALDSLRAEFETNETLFEDFPELCFPIRALDGMAQRAAGQLCKGERTRIKWTGSEIVLPTVRRDGELVPGSGAVVATRGITGAIRGLKVKIGSEAVRPDAAVVDDPQTDEGARSPATVRKLERIIRRAIEKLAGPNQSIAVAVPCTVISEDDLSDRLLDRKRNPDYGGVRRKALYAFPDRLDLWEQYRERHDAQLESENAYDRATAFYLEHREAMDAGAVVAWEHRREPGDASALETLMRMWLRDPVGFAAELQNEPQHEEGADDARRLDPKAVAERTNKLARWRAFDSAALVTAAVDVQERCLFYCVVAVDQRFRGSVVSWGTYPDQKSDYFTLDQVKRRLTTVRRGVTWDEALCAGLERLLEQLDGREYPTETGEPLRLSRVLIDANWHKSTGAIERFARAWSGGATVLASRGRGTKVGEKPIHEFKRKPGDRVGWGWRFTRPTGGGPRQVLFDANAWKSMVYDRLACGVGSLDALTLWGKRADRHRLFADHVASEIGVVHEARGASKELWQPARVNPENHLLDCAVGAFVAASMEGASIPEAGHENAKGGGTGGRSWAASVAAAAKGRRR